MSGGAGRRLEIQGLDHRFGGVHAVRDVTLDFAAGEIVALLGENGAGKSTLMKAVAGALRPDRGEVRLDGRPLPPGNPAAAREAGVSLIYQELSLVQPLTVYENVVLGREPRRGPWFDRAAARRVTAELLERLHAGFHPERRVDSLSVAERQLVEIARALALDARVLIMDEPTSALSAPEAERLFETVRELTAREVAVVLITHRLEEVALLADRVVVMRDGAVVADGPAARFDRPGLIRAMVGRDLERQFPEHEATPGERRVEVRGLARGPRLRHVDLDVRAGEIVALAGLVGSGRTEVGRILYGLDRPEAGSVQVVGRRGGFAGPGAAIAAGVGWVSEDRQGEGLVTSLSVAANLTLPHLERYSSGGWIRAADEREATRGMVERLSIRTAGIDQTVSELSGGNQQKVAFGRWLLFDCRLLICDEPTRGVDVGGRFEIYQLLGRLAERGVGVLMISSDFEEVLGIADRIVVLHEGRSAATLARREADRERLLQLATGAAA